MKEIIDEVIKEHNEDRTHPNWKESCEVCIRKALELSKTKGDK